MLALIMQVVFSGVGGSCGGLNKAGDARTCLRLVVELKIIVKMREREKKAKNCRLSLAVLGDPAVVLTKQVTPGLVYV